MLLDRNIWNYEIAPYLQFVDLYRLKCCNKYLSRCCNLQSKLSNGISKRLCDIFEDNSNEFKALLEQTGAIVSGSFILQSILNENWNSDLDLYVPMHQREKLCNFLYKNIVMRNKYDDGYCWTLEDLQYDDMQTCKIIYHPKIRVCNRYRIDKHKAKIKLWTVDDDHLETFITNTTDLDICRNVYGITGGNEYVKVFRIDQIIDKRTEFKVGKYFTAGLERYFKYQARGFTFTNDLSLMFEKIVRRSGKHLVFWVEQVDEMWYEVIDGDFNNLKLFQHIIIDPKRRKGYPIVPDFILDGHSFKFGPRVKLRDCPDDPANCPFCHYPGYEEHVHCNIKCPVTFCLPETLHFHVSLHDYDLIFIYY